MGAEIEYLDSELEELVCCECQTTFGMPAALVRMRKRDHKTFFCVNGHGQAFVTSESEELAKVKRELSDAMLEIARLKAKPRRWFSR